MDRPIAPLLALILAIATVASPALADSGRVGVHVLYAGPGSHLFTHFGHVAIVLEDRTNGIQKVFNFGEFDMSKPNLKLRYALGDLSYWLAVSSLKATVAHYRRTHREVVLRTLDLSPAQAEKMARLLDRHARPENRAYRYNHFTNNCTTKVRDLVDAVTDGALAKAALAPSGTYREWTAASWRGLTFMRVLVLFLLGTDADRPISRREAQFLPSVLAADLDVARIGPRHRPLISEKRILVPGKRDNSAGGDFFDDALPAVFSGILIVLILWPALFPRARWACRGFGLGAMGFGIIGGLGGTMLLVLLAFTEHRDTHWNENLILFFPTHFWLAVPGASAFVRGRLSKALVRRTSLYAAFALALVAVDAGMKLGPFVQDNAGFAAFSGIGIAAVALSLRAMSNDDGKTGRPEPRAVRACADGGVAKAARR